MMLSKERLVLHRYDGRGRRTVVPMTVAATPSETGTLLVLQHLPRLRAVLSDVLGIEPFEAHSQLDLAEALAVDDLDRAEVVTSMGRALGIKVTAAEVAATESVADLVRLAAAKVAASPRAYA
jgi:acyl carrier protein